MNLLSYVSHLVSKEAHLASDLVVHGYWNAVGRLALPHALNVSPPLRVKMHRNKI